MGRQTITLKLIKNLYGNIPLKLEFKKLKFNKKLKKTSISLKRQNEAIKITKIIINVINGEISGKIE